MLGAAAVGLVMSPAGAQERAPAGTLSCTVARNMRVFVARQQSAACAFTPVSGAPEAYTGLIVRLDREGGAAADRLEWMVLAPPSLARAALAGRYERDSVAGRGDVLHGDSGAVVLQPLSIQGSNGTSIAAGVGELHLWFER
jgi:hypothetical protein